ncbi:NAD-dependent epimerase/dehydratase family protein [Nocardia sp. NPDC101769]|uniref:NAD-dependent epimerase/dehydratase family protein n=1 Tax=Nocardia sp. NPDC101769 TaxID=3364333 RepID=UPI00381A8712
MRVLLTGAAGYLGSHVHRALLAAGHEVVAIDALLETVHGANAAGPEDVSRIDVRDQDALEHLLADIDVVCHLAAAVPLPRLRGAIEPVPTDSSNLAAPQDVPHLRCVPVDRQRGGERAGAEGMRWAGLYAAHNDVGTAVLLAAMERAGVPRLVLGSSVAVYGEGRYRGVRSGPFYPGLRRRGDLDRGLFDHRAPRSGEVLTWEPIGEDAPLRPRSAYAASKVAQERYALAWAANTGGDAAVLRYNQLYGEPVADGRSVRSAESGVVARFRAELVAGRPPQVFEDGGQVRDFVHVRDAAVATVAAVERRLPGFVPLNIASGRPLTLWEVASVLARAMDGPNPVVTGQCRVTDIRHVVAHPERARQALEFTARTQPAKGLSDYAARGIGRR